MLSPNYWSQMLHWILLECHISQERTEKKMCMVFMVLDITELILQNYRITEFSFSCPFSYWYEKLVFVDIDWISFSFGGLGDSFCKTVKLNKACDHTYPSNGKQKKKRTSGLWAIPMSTSGLLWMTSALWTKAMTHYHKTGLNWQLTQFIRVLLLGVPCP